MEPPRKHGVVAVLQDEQGRYLLIKRGPKLARAPGWWCFVGGEVEPDEALAAAIEREVFEEVGLSVRAREQIHESLSPNGEYTLHWIRVTSRAPMEALRLHPEEVAEARWLSAKKILELEAVLPGLRAWLEAAR